MIKILLALVLFQYFANVSSDCVWYGQCNKDNFDRIQNCLYKGAAKPVDNETLSLLGKWCPHMITGSGTTSSCCDVKQMKTFDEQISMSKTFLGRCPSCFRSFVRLICDLVCSANQSDFINVTSVVAKNETEYITGIEVFVTERYLNSTFESCERVTFPSTGQLVLDLMCGEWGASKCTAKRLYEYIGKFGSNKFVPFQVDFVTQLSPNSRFRLIDPRTFKCNESVDEWTPACSCIDCEESCPAFLEEDDDAANGESFKMEYHVFVLICGVILVSIFCYKIFRKREYRLVKYANSTIETIQNSQNIEYTGESEDAICKKAERLVERIFVFLGQICARYPIPILCLGFVLVFVLTLGVQYIQITIDPVELWASSSSQCRKERQYFNENFGPFYRIEQVIVKSKGLDNFVHNTSLGALEFGPAFHEHFMRDAQKLQNEILQLGQPDNGLQKICFSPLMLPGEKPDKAYKCLVQSVFGYFRLTKLNYYRKDSQGFNVTYLDQIVKCVKNMYNPECLALYGGPVDPAVAFGGFLNEGEILSESSSYIRAKALIITILLNNHQRSEDLEATLKWEKKFLDYMKNWTARKPDYMEVSYLSERSIEDEIDRESHANVSIVIISYLAMFCYVAMMLGNFQCSSNFLLESKITLGLGGVIIVFSSVISSIGLNGYLGVKITLIALEVIPFLVLAVGVDNIFILVQACDRNPIREDESVEKYIGRILGKVGPSILQAGYSEYVCFLLGALSDMPCIKAFALYASAAIALNLLLQLTCFVSLLSLDCRRRKNNRLDVFCCIALKSKKIKWNDTLMKIFSKFYTPMVLHKFTRPIVMIGFVLWFMWSMLILPEIDLGLEQYLAMPNDSYLLTYLQDLGKYLAVGPPVYFVVTNGLNVTDTKVQNVLCNGQFCDIDSVTNQLYAASLRTNKTYITKHPSSWIDDYFDWSAITPCCKKFENGSFCPHSNPYCAFCNIERNNFNRPVSQHFDKFLPFFLNDNPSSNCAKGGHAAYGQAVKYNVANQSTEIGPYYFMAFHSVLRKSSDYITALREARNLAENITKTIHSRIPGSENVNVFPYSVFYVFYEQYLTLWETAVKNIGISLLSVFVVSLLLTFGNVTGSVIIVFTVMMIIVNLTATMYYLDIQLNAATLVNIVMAIGIAVEFCCHTVHYFIKSTQSSRENRAVDTLNNIGSSLLSGITLTKFIGISVLGFSSSAIFRIFYFEMYMMIVLISVLHGIVFLPVSLSYFGPISKPLPVTGNQLLKPMEADTKEIE